MYDRHTRIDSVAGDDSRHTFVRQEIPASERGDDAAEAPDNTTPVPPAPVSSPPPAPHAGVAAAPPNATTADASQQEKINRLVALGFDAQRVRPIAASV